MGPRARAVRVSNLGGFRRARADPIRVLRHLQVFRFFFVFHIDSASHEISSVRSLDVCGTLLAGFMPE